MGQIEFREGLFFACPFWVETEYFLELPSRAGFSTVPGRAVERGGRGWRTADAIHLCSHYLVGLGEFDLQSLPMSHFVGAMSRNRLVYTANAMDESVVPMVQHLSGGMSVSSRHRFRLTPPTSDAEAWPRPTTCARLSRHAKLVAMLRLSPKNGF